MRMHVQVCTKALRELLCASTALMLALLSSVPVFAQANYGRIDGTITDQTGGAIVGSTVTVTDVQRGVSRTLVSDSAGAYSAPNLIPGTYTVRAEFKGFSTVDRQDILLETGKDVRVDLSLQPGEQTQTVTVTGEPPAVDTTNAQLSGTIENQAIADLPINGRQYRTLLTLTPGMLATPGTANNKQMGYNNTRPEDLVYLLDGLYSVNPHAGTPTIGGNTAGGGPDQSTILPVDAIQEINVVGNPKAEYGWKPGAQVILGLKSGTNGLHGTAFAFGRDDAFDAKNPFLSPTQPKAAEELEQFGGSIGGPIKKDKLFYFGSYEGQRFLVGTPKQIQEPTTAPGFGTGSSFPDAISDMVNVRHLTQTSSA